MKQVCAHLLACWQRPYAEFDSSILCSECLVTFMIIELQDTNTPAPEIADRVVFACNGNGHAANCQRCYIAIGALLTGVHVDLCFRGQGRLAERLAGLLRHWRKRYGQIHVDNNTQTHQWKTDRRTKRREQHDTDLASLQ